MEINLDRRTRILAQKYYGIILHLRRGEPFRLLLEPMNQPTMPYYYV